MLHSYSVELELTAVSSRHYYYMSVISYVMCHVTNLSPRVLRQVVKAAGVLHVDPEHVSRRAHHGDFKVRDDDGGGGVEPEVSTRSHDRLQQLLVLRLRLAAHTQRDSPGGSTFTIYIY